jgi:hypothetical protein
MKEREIIKLSEIEIRPILNEWAFERYEEDYLNDKGIEIEGNTEEAIIETNKLKYYWIKHIYRIGKLEIILPEDKNLISWINFKPFPPKHVNVIKFQDTVKFI